MSTYSGVMHTNTNRIVTTPRCLIFSLNIILFYVCVCVLQRVGGVADSVFGNWRVRSCVCVRASRMYLMYVLHSVRHKQNKL